ncbi:cell wall-associated hydrolase, invasion-associated protein [Acidovorax sp. CF316]|uniref:C40 family peptidase n=1 Tax=Acidovorax sp. CF316 TaxID=1144317 RepID=UPI00026BD0A4|nr:C40 family peptidase [Acidovorax sp. CF316]EJE48361.1 cell wall-associated hydrolase, invasion-associated protein [Acidovorax sp. CF316]
MRVLSCLALVSAALLIAGCGSSRPTPSSSSSSFPSAPVRTTPPLSPDQAHGIAIHALGLVGTPYRYGGNTPDSGFDCSGLIGYVYRNQVGTPPPRTVAALNSWGYPLEGGELRAGDLVVFGTGRQPNHAGIYVGEGRFVHAPSTGGTVRLDYLSAKHWAGQKPAFRRP